MKKLTFFLVFTLMWSSPTYGQEKKGFLRELLRKGLERKAQNTVVDAEKVTMTHGGKQRSYYLHVPKSWNKRDLLPLVFLFHGGGGGGKQALDSYEMIQKSDEAVFLLVAPNGTGQTEDILLTWNVGFGWGQAQKDKVDDVGFVKELIEKLEGEYPIDTDRIFATGMSNGAFLCHLLAAQPDNRFAAIAPVVGSLGGKELSQKDFTLPPQPASPVSVMLVNGLIDDHVPPEGGLQKKSITEPRIMTSASQTIDFWVRADGCATNPQTLYDEALKASVTRYSKGNNGTEVFLYLLHNQGHAWPGSTKTSRAAVDKPSPDFPANDLIWEFFKAHPRKKSP